MGMGWGDPDPEPEPEPEPTYSDLPAPSVYFLGEYGPDGTRSPLRIALAPNGGVVVTDPGARRVLALRPDGRLRFTIPNLGRPLSVAVGGQQGNIYVGLDGSGLVRIFSPTGHPIGQLGQGKGEFRMPNDMVWNPANDAVYVVDSRAARVRAYDSGGDFLFEFGSPGEEDGQFRFPAGIALDEAAQEILVTDHTTALVQVFDANGGWLRSFGGYGSDLKLFGRPGGMALDAIGRLYVTDAFQGRIQIVDTSGYHVSYLGDYGHQEGELALSSDAVMDPYGRLWVSSYARGKVLVYGIDEFAVPDLSLDAEVVLEPAHIKNDAEKGWVTAYIEVPQSSAEEILAESLRIEESLQPRLDDSLVVWGDHDLDGVADLSVQFSRSALLQLVEGPGVHTLLLTGELTGGEFIDGEVTLEVRDADKSAQTVGLKTHGKSPRWNRTVQTASAGE